LDAIPRRILYALSAGGVLFAEDLAKALAFRFRRGTLPPMSPPDSRLGRHLYKKQGWCKMALEAELETFEKRLPELLPRENGRFALVHGDDVSVWPNADAAIDAGYNRYGFDRFLVKEIVEQEKPRYFSRRVTRWQWSPEK
jgi:hypothetical protein